MQIKLRTERTNNFFKSKLGLERLKKAYLRLARMSVKQKSNPARSSETVKRSRVMVTEGSESSNMIFINKRAYSCISVSQKLLAGT